MDRVALFGIDRAEVVHGLPDDVQDASERRLADGHRDGAAGVERGHAAHDSLGRLHRDRADAALAEVLLDFGDEVYGRGHVEALASDAQRLINRRQVAVAALHVAHWADDLHDAPRRETGGGGVGVCGHALLFSAPLRLKLCTARKSLWF